MDNLCIAMYLLGNGLIYLRHTPDENKCLRFINSLVAHETWIPVDPHMELDDFDF